MALLVRKDKLKFLIAAWLCTLILDAVAVETPVSGAKAAVGSVKKDLKLPAPPELATLVATLPPDEAKPEAVVVISEKSLIELEAEKSKNNAKQSETASPEKHKAITPPSAPNNQVSEDVPIAASHMQVVKEREPKTFYREILDSYWLGMLAFPAIAFAFILHLMLKYQKMRAVHRSERKYGVQGNRTTQELTPLPIYIEDGNSDDEDQTLFDINSREQLRIL